MKVFGVCTSATNTDAVFYIQASNKEQADFILTSKLKAKLNPDLQLLVAEQHHVIPTISRIILSLSPWDNNLHASTQQLSMQTHGLTLTTAVASHQTRNIANFCGNLDQALKVGETANSWAALINSDCASFSGQRLFPVLVYADSATATQIYIAAPANSDAAAKIETVMRQCFINATGYVMSSEHLPFGTAPVIELKSHLNATGLTFFELNYSSMGLTLSTTVFEIDLRHVLLLCEDYGVELQGRAGSTHHAYMRRELRILALKGVYTRSGTDDDVRPYTDYRETMLMQKLLKEAMGASSLSPARDGQRFNGVIFNATPTGATTGFMYLSTDFPEGQFIMTAEVVKAGMTGKGIRYIETMDGYRFVVTAYSSQEMTAFLRFLEVNEDYFSLYRWS
jgi:hypothetical protein